MSMYESESNYQGVQGEQSNEAAQQREGSIARSIERQTARIPSDAFLWAAGVSMLASLGFQVLGPRPRAARMFGMRRAVEGRAPLAMFIGQWVPTLLLFGIYNKIVKVAGSDRFTR